MSSKLSLKDLVFNAVSELRRDASHPSEHGTESSWAYRRQLADDLEAALAASGTCEQCLHYRLVIEAYEKGELPASKTLAASGSEQSDEEHPCTKNDNSCLRLACRFPICANTDDGLEFSSVDEYARKVGIRPASGSESDANNPKDKCAWPTPWGTCEAYRHEHYPSSQHQFVEPQPPALPSRDEIVKAIVLALALFRAENKDVAQQIESKENQER